MNNLKKTNEAIESLWQRMRDLGMLDNLTPRECESLYADIKRISEVTLQDAAKVVVSLTNLITTL